MADRNFKPDSGNDLVLEDAGSTDRLRITDGGSTILYEDGGTAALTIDTSGNTEITQNIEQADGKNIQTDEIRARDGDGLKLYDDGGSGIFVEDGGQVGIGTTVPANNVHIHTDASTQGLLIKSTGNTSQNLIFDSNLTSAADNIAFIHGYWNGTAVAAMNFVTGADTSNKDDGLIAFGTASAGTLIERMRIETTGNVGIPTVNASHKLQVTGSAGLSTGTAWTNTSDERIKTNIKTIENALAKINQLRPVSYNYSKDYLDQHPELSDSKKYNSFIAQEYAQVFPDAVSVGENLEKITVESVEAKEAVLDKDGNEISPAVEAVEEVREILVENMLQFTPHDLNMYLVGAVQELSAKVTALENA